MLAYFSIPCSHSFWDVYCEDLSLSFDHQFNPWLCHSIISAHDMACRLPAAPLHSSCASWWCPTSHMYANHHCTLHYKQQEANSKGDQHLGRIFRVLKCRIFNWAQIVFHENLNKFFLFSKAKNEWTQNTQTK